MRLVFIWLLLFSNALAYSANECHHRDYGNGGTVCVCNAVHCDTIAPLEKLAAGTYALYTSSKEGFRMRRQLGRFKVLEALPQEENRVKIQADTTYQRIQGWGGAFTDSFGLNVNSLGENTRKALLRSYFSIDGAEYSLCRVPIGGTDFSTRPYSYNDGPEDVALRNFSLQPEDYDLKIPLIKEAKAIANGSAVLLLASAWSPPPWMKTNNDVKGESRLKGAMYQSWADYFVKFLDAYVREGIDIWAVTTGNEPINGLLPVISGNIIKIPSLGWLPHEQTKWIAENLGPTLEENYPDVKILALDDQRFFLPWWIVNLFKNEVTAKYVAGIAVHWYWDKVTPPALLTQTHKRFPDKFIISSEACIGDQPFEKKVDLGSWHRGEKYVIDIIQDMNHWVAAWVDWNMALNPEGGPTYIDNFVDSPIIVNASANEFYKQPMYYALAHFSKFVPRDSLRIKVEQSFTQLQIVAFSRPDQGKTVVLFNSAEEDVEVVVEDAVRGRVDLLVPKKSFNTMIYW